MSRPLPVMFIHGLNGDPGDWTDSGFRQVLLAQGDLSTRPGAPLPLRRRRGRHL